MNKELDYIASVTSVGDLPQKIEKAENAKVEVEAKILERVCVFISFTTIYEITFL